MNRGSVVSSFVIPIFLLHISCATTQSSTTREIHPMYAEAEYKRLARELQRLERKERWEMLDRIFTDIQALKVDIQADHWLMAANANQEIGNLSKTHRYLSSALKVKSNSKTKLWLRDIEENYGEVYLVAKSQADFIFEAKEMPIDPVPSKCIQYASSTIQDTRKFKGMLPKGKYTFVDETFEVLPGIEVRRELDPSLRKKGLKKALITKPVEIFED